MTQIIEYPKWQFHHKLAPDGRVFNSAEELAAVKYEGWVDNPAQFPKPSQIPARLMKLKPHWENWRWLLALIAAVLGIAKLVVSLLKG